MSLQFSAILAAIFAIALVPLTLQVGIKRVSTGIFFGDGGNKDLARRRAAQSNFLDHVPLFLLVFALCEMNGAGPPVLFGAGGCMLLGRAFHAFSMLATDGTGNSRAFGMILTLLAHLGVAGYLLYVLL
ncbi:MAPEG family protein [Kordiimonas lacus]|uniref:MAPEG family protein n=1 Tax=Kordiimonas lacus TaxID=637679 RepID=A0A1G6WFL2_9PROT|nr:MAPEG family protein [Kordiimonas lacus]SDD64621.1 hypothetical protein SAMN04488071_1090 [Kordiimonas lacus]